LCKKGRKGPCASPMLATLARRRAISPPFMHFLLKHLAKVRLACQRVSPPGQKHSVNCGHFLPETKHSVNFGHFLPGQKHSHNSRRQRKHSAHLLMTLPPEKKRSESRECHGPTPPYPPPHRRRVWPLPRRHACRPRRRRRTPRRCPALMSPPSATPPPICREQEAKVSQGRGLGMYPARQTDQRTLLNFGNFGWSVGGPRGKMTT
jgi:hypothetical protein